MARPLLPSVAVVLAASLPACAVFRPEAPAWRSIEPIREAIDSAAYQARPMPEDLPVRERALHYLPNRLLDLLDVFKVSIGVGPGVGLEVYATRNVWLGYEWWRSWRLGIDGRASGFYEEGHFREWRLGDRVNPDAAAGRRPLFALRDLRPFEKPLVPGVPAVPEVPRNDWDVGVRAHLLLVGAEALVRPFEVFDFLVGLWGDDPALDDYGLRWFPLHEYAPQEDVVDRFVNALDRLDAAALLDVLCRDLRRSSFARVRSGLAPLAERSDDAARADPEAWILGDVEIEPDRYRGEDGHLEHATRCLGVYLRYGVPARIDYEVTFYNRYTRTPRTLELSLEVERGRWVIRRIRDADAP